MNYHLMIDDKFIDGFINDAEKVSSGKNVYIIEGNREISKYAKHPLITFVSSLKQYLQVLKTRLVSNDNIFIHWLHDCITDFILSLPSQNKVGLFFWAGDIVQDPDEVYKEYNYEPLSLEYYEKH